MNIINDVLVDKLFKDKPKRTKEIPLLEEKSMSGETIVIIDAYQDMPLKGLNLYGKSTQTTTTGAQLFDVDAGGTGWLNQETGEFEVNNSNYVSEYIPVKSGAQYYINYDISQYVYSYDSSKQFLRKETYKNSFAVGDDVFYIRFGISDNKEVALKKAKTIMLNEGSVANPYEPYTGGKPSPSPEYPQEIKNVGDKGNVGVSVTGKNLLPNTVVLPDKTDKGIVWTYKSDGVYHVSGTSTGVFDSPILQFTDFNLPLGTYRMINSKNVTPNIVVTKSDGRDIWYSSVFTIEKGDKIKYWYCIVLNGKTVDTDVYAYLELDTGSQPTKEDFEPYKPPQTLTLLTPNGLPGIPATSDGNYTDETGQQWICDEIDLERGKYVQRVLKMIFDGTEKWFSWGANTNGNIGFYYYTNALESDSNIKGKHCISNYLPYSSGAYNGDKIGVNVITGSSVTFTYIIVSLKQSDLADVGSSELAIKSFKEFLANKKENGVPFEIYCQLLEPIETDLSPEVIEQYKQIHTNYPTTTVLNDAGMWMEMRYLSPAIIPKKEYALRMWFKENPII